MAAADAPSRRKSGPSAAGDDSSRPQKRQKTDDGSAATQDAPEKARSGPGRPRKSQNTQVEEADGFTFRKRGRPPKAKPAVAPSAVQVDASAPSGSPRRRSARLSIENDPATAEGASADFATEKTTQKVAPARSKPGRKPKAAQEQRTTPTPNAGPLKVEKKREGTKIALPFADTPVIDRNRQMRDIGVVGRRRSSGGQRGKRASELMESGKSNAIPHNEVRTDDFYKHISPDLPEPRRMKQLLTWCGTRALPGKPPRTSGNFNALAAALTIEEELLKDFSNKSEMSDWFNRDDVRPEVLVKKANPRNLQNAAKLLELEQEVKRLEKEKASWQDHLRLLEDSLDKQRQESSTVPPAATTIAQASSISEKVLDDEDQAECLQLLRKSSVQVSTTASRLRAACESIEFNVDHFYHGVHHLDKVATLVDEVADKVLSSAATALSEREKASLERSGMEKVGVGDILRGISRAS